MKKSHLKSSAAQRPTRRATPTADPKAAKRGRADRDQEARTGVFAQAWNYLLQADVESAKKFIRDYVFASTGIAAFARGTKISPRKLTRMLKPGAGVRLKELCEVLGYIRTKEGLEFTLRLVRTRTKP
jgi:hypothetical protein